MLGSSFAGGWQHLQSCLSWAGGDFPKSKAKKKISKNLGLLENHGVKGVCLLNFLMINFKGDGGKAMTVE